ncbi:MAG: NAD(P)-dependent oxidoreductase [Thermodesulfobacteriota bacterium]
MTKIGWIGTGVMGAQMAGHLQAAGYDLYIFNRTRQKAESLISKGAKWCDSVAEVAANSEILFTMVSFPADVEEIYFGERGIFSVDGPCRTAVDMTTSRPMLARMIDKEATKKGMESLDAPVSGGDIGARNATLAIMAGGKKESFNNILPLFQLMGQNISYMGGSGAGQHTKMCNQILVAGTMIGVCESLLYAEKAGLDQQSVIDIIGKGAASCWSINNLGPRIVRGDFGPGFIVEHFVKDMGIALREAASAGLSLPGLALVHQLYLAVKAQGNSRSGTQALILALRTLNGS